MQEDFPRENKEGKQKDLGDPNSFSFFEENLELKHIAQVVDKEGKSKNLYTDSGKEEFFQIDARENPKILLAIT